MCIIIAKNKNDRLPSEQELETSFYYNGDGAGLMYTDGGKVIIDKGYMNYKSFLKHYKRLLKKYNNFEGKSLVIHFRIGTSGTNSPENTHPYPITNNKNNLKKRYIKNDIGIAHNGIIHDYTPRGKNDTNDTKEFIIKYLTPLYKNYRTFYKNKYIREGIESITGSKFAILTGKDELVLIGDFINDKGLSFSNSTYKTYSYYSGYNSYNYYDDYHYNYDYKKDEYKTIDESDYITLEKDWYIEYGDKLEKVGNRDLIYNVSTMRLFEYDNDNITKVASDVVIYDKNYMEVI